jgi:dienelactone hydrolase
MMRRPAIVAFRGEKLVGTVHQPARDAARTAVLLLNPGPAPRAGNSDLSARFGDALARAGVRVFRFDQSGAGDATGESWRTLDDCRAESQRGERPVAEVGAIVDAILARDDTDGVIVGGLCAGATIAMRVADARARAGAGADLTGVFVLEPDLRRAAPDDSLAARRRRFVRTTRAALMRIPVLGRVLGAILARVRRSTGTALAHAGPMRDPIDPNLLGAWRRTLARGTPVLAITALGLDGDRDLDELLGALGDPRLGDPRPRDSRLSDTRLSDTRLSDSRIGARDTHHPTRLRISDANHLFTLAGCVDRVAAEATPWVVAQAANPRAATASAQS